MNGIDRDTPAWFVMRAHRAELKVEEKLSQQEELLYFVPKQYAVRVYHGKRVRKLVPVIPGIVFVYGSRAQIAPFKYRCEQLQYLMCKKSTGPEYMIVPEDQMQSFIKVASDLERNNVYLNPEEVQLKKGTRVKIIGGALDGAVGHFVKVKNYRNRRLVVLLEGVTAIATEVSPDLIEVLPD